MMEAMRMTKTTPRTPWTNKPVATVAFTQPEIKRAHSLTVLHSDTSDMPRQNTSAASTVGVRRLDRKKVAAAKAKRPLPQAILPNGRIPKKLGPRAGTRRIQADVFPVLQGYASNVVDDIMERVCIICKQAGRRTVRGAHVSAAMRTTGKTFLCAS